MRKVHYAIVIIPIVTLLFGYFYSIVSYRGDIFPYPQIKVIYTIIFDDYAAEKLHEKVQEKIDKVTVTGNREGPIDLNNLVRDGRVIESLTVPFLKRSVEIKSLVEYGVPLIKGPGGGVCRAGNFLVLLGGQGNGVLIKLDTMTVTGQISFSNMDSERGGEFNGILDVACDTVINPQIAYIIYQRIHREVADPAVQFRTIVVKVDLADFQNASLSHVWTSELTGQNFAGRLVALPGNKALISFSDSEPYGKLQTNGLFRPQDPNTLVGKIIRVDLSSGHHEIYSQGHRNPQGLFITPEGEIYETEHGPKGGDELNFIVSGGNYGWPHESHGVDYGSYRWKHGEAGRHDNFDRPVFSWVPSIAVSNLIRVEDFHPSWKGDFLVASLKAQSLYRLRLDKDHKVEFVEQIWIGSRIRDLVEIDASRIALWTDDSKLIILSVASKFLEGDRRTTTSIVTSTLEDCLQCHHFEVTNATHLAPTLGMIFSKPIASDNFKYSESLSAKEGKWTPEKLKKFIMDPQAFAPGSSMAYNVENEAKANELVELLIKIDKMGQ